MFFWLLQLQSISGFSSASVKNTPQKNCMVNFFSIGSLAFIRVCLLVSAWSSWISYLFSLPSYLFLLHRSLHNCMEIFKTHFILWLKSSHWGPCPILVTACCSTFLSIISQCNYFVTFFNMLPCYLFAPSITISASSIFSPFYNFHLPCTFKF